jgi:methyl-accepting chemotaxis protein
MKLSTRMHLITAVFVGSMVVTTLASAVLIHRLGQVALAATNIHMPAIRSQMNMDMMHDGLRAVAYSAVVSVTTGDAEMLKTSGEELGEFKELFLHELGELEQLPLDPAIHAKLGTMRPKLDAYLAQVSQVVSSAIAGKAEEMKGGLPALQKTFKELETEMAQLGDDIEGGAQSVIVNANSTTKRSMFILLGIAGIAITAGLGLGLSITRMVNRRTAQLGAGMGRLATGDLSTRTGMTADDELGIVGVSLDRMSIAVSTSIRAVRENADAVAGVAEAVQTTCGTMRSSSDEVSRHASTIAASTRDVSSGVASVAAGMEEMSASVREIANSAQNAAGIAGNAVTLAKDASTGMARLGTASDEIGKVLQMIAAIAEQTNLLALNATIEAARAGSAGAGFAVVANEVKELARQTAKATTEIGGRISSMQGEVSSAMATITQISDVITKVNEIQGTIASAVQEQSATTSEISRSIAEAATGTNSIATDADRMVASLASANAAAGKMQGVADHLGSSSVTLHKSVSGFTI